MLASQSIIAPTAPVLNFQDFVRSASLTSFQSSVSRPQPPPSSASSRLVTGRVKGGHKHAFAPFVISVMACAPMASLAGPGRQHPCRVADAHHRDASTTSRAAAARASACHQVGVHAHALVHRTSVYSAQTYAHVRASMARWLQCFFLYAPQATAREFLAKQL